MFDAKTEAQNIPAWTTWDEETQRTVVMVLDCAYQKGRFSVTGDLSGPEPRPMAYCRQDYHSKR